MEKHSAKNATYLSKTSQNECMGDNILHKILADVKANRFFGLEADEITDTSGWEQLGLGLRYVKNNKPVGRLVSFISCDSVTGAAVCTKIFYALVSFGLDAKFCRAQAYDGAGSMSGHLNGCQARFRQSVPNATHYHCSSHQLNLALSKACTVPAIQSMLSDVMAVGIFFNYSLKRQWRLEQAIIEINVRRDKERVLKVVPTKVKLMCETRWVERHTVLVEFADMYEPIVVCLEAIGTSDSNSPFPISYNGIYARDVTFGGLERPSGASFTLKCMEKVHAFEHLPLPDTGELPALSAYRSSVRESALPIIFVGASCDEVSRKCEPGKLYGVRAISLV